MRATFGKQANRQREPWFFFSLFNLPRQNCKRCKLHQLTKKKHQNTICMNPLTWSRRAQRWTLECIQHKNVPRRLSLLYVQWLLANFLGIRAPLHCLWKRKKGLKSKRIEDGFLYLLSCQIVNPLNRLFWFYRYWRPMNETTKFKTVSSIWNAICLFCGFQSAIHTMQRIKWHQTQFQLMDFSLKCR